MSAKHPERVISLLRQLKRTDLLAVDEQADNDAIAVAQGLGLIELLRKSTIDPQNGTECYKGMVMQITPAGIEALLWDHGDSATVVKQQGEKDGPHPPNLLIVDGQTIELPPTLWKLARFMWDRKSATFEEVVDEAWGHDQDVSDSTIRSAVSKLMDAITKALPVACKYLNLSTKSAHIVNSPDRS